MDDLSRTSIYVSASLATLPLLALWLRRQSQRKAVESPKMAETNAKTVVIIGASWAGINVAHGLLKQVPDAKVVLINPSEEFFFNIAAPRIVAKPDAIAREKYIYSITSLFEKYPNFKTALEFVRGKATAIDLQAKKVTVVQGSTLPAREVSYDYLVIASGSTSCAATGKESLKVPFKPSVQGSPIDVELKDSQEAIKAAKSVIIGGAGAVGVEFAGEISEAYPNTKITLLTNTDSILTSLNKSSRQHASNLLKAKGVEIVTQAQVKSAVFDSTLNKWNVTLAGDKDEVLSADAYVATTGALPNNDFIPASLLNEAGWVEVDQHFKVPSADSVYAVGDITHYPARLISRIAGQVSVLISNLKADITGSGKRANYNPDQALMVVVPIGKSSGTGQLGFFTPPGFLVWLVKGRDYFTGSGKKFIAG